MITLFQTIMKLVLKIMESLFHLNYSISNIIKVLFIITNDSIKKYGFYQTYRVLSYMRTIITHRTIISAVTFNSVIKFNSKLNKDIVDIILQAISPYLQSCINSKVSFIVFYNIFFFSVILGIIINFIITISLNILIVLLISSLAIIWNNVLSDIPFLIEWADYIISNYENLTGFNVPRPNIMNNISEDNEVSGTVNKIIKEIDQSSPKDISSGKPNHNSLDIVENVLYYTVWTLFGVVVVTSVVLILDHDPKLHEVLHQIPKIDYVLDPMYNTYYFIVDYFSTPKYIPFEEPKHIPFRFDYDGISDLSDKNFSELVTRMLYPNIDNNPNNFYINVIDVDNYPNHYYLNIVDINIYALLITYSSS